jgi:hypothetical protein
MILSSLRHAGAVLGFCAAVTASPVLGQEVREGTDRLLDLLQLSETIEIMRDEGVAYADTLVEDMLPGPAGSGWDGTVGRIYDTDRMEATVRDGFAEAYGTQDVNTDALERFFGSELGRDIVRLEISARRAMSEEAIEETARAAYFDALEGSAAQQARLEQLETMVTSNDLIEANVVGGMNSSVRFYQGLADGGAIELSEGDILAQVWGSEEETRTDTTEWIYGYLLMAYGPVRDVDLAAYVELLGSPEGRMMNRALFHGFDRMFSDISYALGRALALEMQAEEL